MTGKDFRFSSHQKTSLPDHNHTTGRRFFHGYTVWLVTPEGETHLGSISYTWTSYVAPRANQPKVWHYGNGSTIKGTRLDAANALLNFHNEVLS